MKIKIKILMVCLLLFGCNSSNKELIVNPEEGIYNLINTAYKDLLEQDSFPLHILNQPFNLGFWSVIGDSIKFNGHKFYFRNSGYYNELDTTFLWHPDSLLDYTVIPYSEVFKINAFDYDIFKVSFGMGFLFSSIPAFDSAHQYALIRDNKIFQDDTEGRYILFKKVNEVWEVERIELIPVDR
jgi:hypothetical protein